MSGGGGGPGVLARKKRSTYIPGICDVLRTSQILNKLKGSKPLENFESCWEGGALFGGLLLGEHSFSFRAPFFSQTPLASLSSVKKQDFTLSPPCQGGGRAFGDGGHSRNRADQVIGVCGPWQPQTARLQRFIKFDTRRGYNIRGNSLLPAPATPQPTPRPEIPWRINSPCLLTEEWQLGCFLTENKSCRYMSILRRINPPRKSPAVGSAALIYITWIAEAWAAFTKEFVRFCLLTPLVNDGVYEKIVSLPKWRDPISAVIAQAALILAEQLADDPELCRLLAPHLTTRILPVNKKVLATLWLLGNQESFRGVGDGF
ncbi:hypothetical protein GWK47_027144 [Chionoecetes opilio]|uniref:Uncharacterized protein n=1 Tax=Chionoecetes opilio TaxID=41210 RepID=A0A8J8WCI9_CHIOP|nr:hypothetical protein GWK47_027144 [Chionoecetes opilio]